MLLTFASSNDVSPHQSLFLIGIVVLRNRHYKLLINIVIQFLFDTFLKMYLTGMHHQMIKGELLSGQRIAIIYNE